MKQVASRSIAHRLLLATCALVLATGCWHSPARQAQPPAVSAAPAAPPAVPPIFVGSAACAECHQAETGTQSHSRHALTLFPMSRRVLGKFAPPTGPIPGTDFVVQEQGDRLLIAAAAQPEMAVPLDFAFGSGKTGMTYVFIPDATRLIELRASYFPRRKKWYATPGQERLAAQNVGGVFPQQAARECFLCHSVTVAADALVPQRQFFGVGCEACHGPGSAHIATMRAGRYADIQIERMASWPATRLNAMCGRCHGTEQEAQSQPADIVRLQSVSLMRSECFKQSRETLSCITCHDPHTDAGTAARTYEAICLRCHAASPSAQRPAPLRTAAIKSCPVNPTDKCIGCHMPRLPAITSASAPTLMADHRIRVLAGNRYHGNLQDRQDAIRQQRAPNKERDHDDGR